VTLWQPTHRQAVIAKEPLSSSTVWLLLLLMIR
jgi:hypothetical protein